MLPNFLGIGAQRAATTWIYNCLKEHPDVFVPEIKEVQYFSNNYSKRLSYYENFFKKYNNESAIGEISPEYLHYCDCPTRIKKTLGDVRFIVVLRDPVERAFSAYLFFDQYKNLSFMEAINNYPALLSAGLYASQLKSYFSIFNENDFLILLYEDLQSNNKDYVKKIYEFLNVDPVFTTSMVDRSVNTKIFPKTQKYIESLGARPLLDKIKLSSAGDMIRKYHKNKLSKNKDKLNNTEIELLFQYYSKSNQELKKMLDLDFSKWHF